jgi:hypothetical protein
MHLTVVRDEGTVLWDAPQPGVASRLRQLPKGTRLAGVAIPPTEGMLKARTEDGLEGWLESIDVELDGTVPDVMTAAAGSPAQHPSSTGSNDRLESPAANLVSCGSSPSQASRS